MQNSKFNPELLTANEGSLYGFLHENSNVGLPLGMFWNFYLPFGEITLDDEKVSTSVLIDWMTWPIKSWRDLDSLKLSNLLEPEHLEVSFYLLEHQHAELKSLRIEHETGASFKVGYELKIPELVGPNGEEWENISIRSTSSVSFDGFYIVPANLEDGGPKSGTEAEALLGKYLKAEEFEKPFWDKDFRYTFFPKNEP